MLGTHYLVFQNLKSTVDGDSRARRDKAYYLPLLLRNSKAEVSAISIYENTGNVQKGNRKQSFGPNMSRFD